MESRLKRRTFSKAKIFPSFFGAIQLAPLGEVKEQSGTASSTSVTIDKPSSLSGDSRKSVICS